MHGNVFSNLFIHVMDRKRRLLDGSKGTDRKKPSILRGLQRTWVTSNAASRCEKDARAEETSARIPHGSGMQETTAHVAKWHGKQIASSNSQRISGRQASKRKRSIGALESVFTCAPITMSFEPSLRVYMVSVSSAAQNVI